MSPKKSTTTNKKSKGLTDEEKAAMKARARELKAEERASKNKAEVDCCWRGQDRRAREESGERRMKAVTNPAPIDGLYGPVAALF